MQFRVHCLLVGPQLPFRVCIGLGPSLRDFPCQRFSLLWSKGWGVFHFLLVFSIWPSGVGDRDGFEDTDAFKQVPDKYLNRLFSCARTLENLFHLLSLSFLVCKIEMDIITKFLARIKWDKQQLVLALLDNRNYTVLVFLPCWPLQCTPPWLCHTSSTGSWTFITVLADCVYGSWHLTCLSESRKDVFLCLAHMQQTLDTQ